MTVTTTEAIRVIAEAKSRGATVLCSKCRTNEATLLLSCRPDGTVQGTACSACWASHLDFIEMSQIAIVSGMVEAACCSRCGADPVAPDHIITQEV